MASFRRHQGHTGRFPQILAALAPAPALYHGLGHGPVLGLGLDLDLDHVLVHLPDLESELGDEEIGCDCLLQARSGRCRGDWEKDDGSETAGEIVSVVEKRLIHATATVRLPYLALALAHVHVHVHAPRHVP